MATDIFRRLVKPVTVEHPWRSKWVKPVTVLSVTYTWWIRDKSLLEKTQPTEGYNPWRMETKILFKNLSFCWNPWRPSYNPWRMETNIRFKNLSFCDRSVTLPWWLSNFDRHGCWPSRVLPRPVFRATAHPLHLTGFFRGSFGNKQKLKIAGFFASLPFVTYRCNKILKPSTHCIQL